MPTPSLTRQEAADRTERVHPHRCEVDLDLTGAPDAARRTFPVEVAWTFSFDRADGPDETFLDFTGERDAAGRAHEMRQVVRRWTGIPTCVGLGPTRTLAKVARCPHPTRPASPRRRAGARMRGNRRSRAHGWTPWSGWSGWVVLG